MSRRQYVTQSDIAEFSNIQITDATEADDQISQAEEMVDAYVGFQKKHISDEKSGLVTAGGDNYLIDTSGDSPLKSYNDDYFTFCEVWIIGGTGKGQKRLISSSDKSSNKVTVSTNWSTNPDNTSFYVIKQIGKFPRHWDVFQDSNNKYYKNIPEAVQRATLAQLEYIIEKGNDFFAGAVDYYGEELGGYNYNVKGGADRFISPEARKLLKGIYNKKGRIVA
jgi:hypothetical protein